MYSEWGIDAHVVSACHDALRNLVFIHSGSVRNLLNARASLVFLFELVDFLVHLVERPHLVQGQSHDSALLGYSLQDALANPPYGIRDELEASGLVKAFCCLDEADVAFVYQVGEGKPLMLILLGYRHNKSQVGFYQLVLGSLSGSTRRSSPCVPARA